MQSQNQHPASPYVVYGNIGPPPEPNSTEEMYARELKLQISAKRQAISIIDYEIKKAEFQNDEYMLFQSHVFVHHHQLYVQMVNTIDFQIKNGTTQ